jgi:hypothetical protein
MLINRFCLDKLSRLFSMLLLALLSANPAMAHHGFGRFDPTTEIQIEGTLTDLEFVNPHSYVYFETVASDGTVREMGCEMRAATVLRRSGWSAELFIEGAHIVVNGNPHRDDPSSCYVETLAIGEAPTLERYQQLNEDDSVNRPERALRLSDGTPNIFGDWAQEQYLMAQPKAVGARGVLVPKSMVESIESGEIDSGQAPGAGWGARPVTLTAAGEAAAEVLRNEPPEENPRVTCQITSILFDWVFDGPINRISQGESSITIEYGRDLVRTIVMNMNNHPATIALSKNGHSIGRWEDDTLVVDTVGFLPGRLAGNVPHSDQLHVTERFTLQSDWLNRVALQREFQAEDAIYFTDLYSGNDSVLLADAPFAVDECKELAFEYK